MGLADYYKKAKEKAKTKVEKLQKEVEEKGAEGVTQEYLDKGKSVAKKAALKTAKVATSKTAKITYKTAAGTVSGTKTLVAVKIGKWLDENYPTVIDQMDDRHKRGAKYGIIAAHLIGKARDGLARKLDQARHGLEEKKKQFTLEETIPELYIAVGLADKFLEEEGTMQNREYEMGDGVKYHIDKYSTRFEIKTTSPDGRELTIAYHMPKENGLEILKHDMKMLLDDLVTRIEEYNDPTLKSFGKTTRDVQTGMKKVYTSAFSKKDHELTFDYSLRKGERKCSYVHFAGHGINTQEEEK